MARAWLGRLHLKRGRLTEAADLLAEADRILPANPTVLGLLGDVALRQGRLDEALTTYQRAYDASRNPAYVAAESRVLARKGDAAGSARALDRAIASLRRDLGSGEFGHRRDLAHFLLERGAKGDAQEALALLDKELVERADSETRDLHAWALACCGAFTQALREQQANLASGVRDAVVFARAAHVAELAGDAVAATRWRQQALATDLGYLADPAMLPDKPTRPAV